MMNGYVDTSNNYSCFLQPDHPQVEAETRRLGDRNSELDKEVTRLQAEVC
jgi:hypothetical protein